MTVGITLTNGKESIVITDSRVSGWGRQSDSVDKMGDFSREDYSGVIYGTGFGNFIEGIIRNLGDFPGDNLDEFVNSVFTTHRARVDSYDRDILEQNRREIAKRARVMSPEAQLDSIVERANHIEEAGRDEFIKRELARVLKRYDDYFNKELSSLVEGYERSKQDPSNQTSFMLVGFDNKVEKIRLFGIHPTGFVEIYVNHAEIGSGADGANLYLSKVLQGVDVRKLDDSTLAFFVVNAYSTATVNQGVGGTPKLARISKNGVKIFDLEQTRILTNLSSAYLSDFNNDLTVRKVIDFFSKVKEEPKRDVKSEIAKLVGLNIETLVSTYIPLSSWYERTNRDLFLLTGNGRKID